MNRLFAGRRSIRRTAVLGAALFIGSATLAACGSGGEAESSGSLKVMTWGGVFTEAEKSAYYEPFTEATGTKVVEVSPVSLAKIKAGVTNKTHDVDVSSLSVSEYFQAVDEGLLEPIDYEIVDKGDAPDDVFEEFGVKANSISYQLVYNSDTFSQQGPESWADFYDVETFPGDRALWDSPVGNIEFALLADGVSVDELYPLDDEKLERAFAKLDEIKPHIKVWWQQGAQSQQLFQDGEVDLMMMWNGRATDLIAQGQPLTQVWNQAGLAVNRWIVPKGTPNAKSAMEFINSSLDPQRQAEFAQSLGYGPSVPAAFDLLSDEEAERQPGAPSHGDIEFEIDGQWWGTHLAEVLPQWQSWLAKG